MCRLCGCFAMDSVAGAAFGMDVNSLTNPDDVFIKCCRKLLKQNQWLMPLMCESNCCLLPSSDPGSPAFNLTPVFYSLFLRHHFYLSSSFFFFFF